MAYVTCYKHATKTDVQNIENGHCLSWKFDHFTCELSTVNYTGGRYNRPVPNVKITHTNPDGTHTVTGTSEFGNPLVFFEVPDAHLADS